MATIAPGLRAPKPAAPSARGYPPDPSCQPCPECKGLECLCRPRFFAGQLLTEEDLGRLDHYITAKNKLHNRYLFGPGVVSGLEVLCAPCPGGTVRVTSGYAISPCGEDIIVCKDDTVDICKLIEGCRPDVPIDCLPYGDNDICGDMIEDWILAIRYAEVPSRGMTALVGAGTGCGCGNGKASCGCSGSAGSCGCGGSSGGSCGCGGSCGGSCGCSGGTVDAHPATMATSSTPRARRGAPPTCEPSLTCESYRYTVFRAPEPDDPKQDDRPGFGGFFAKLEGDMMARIACCFKQLEASLPKPPATGASNQDQFNWACRARDAIAGWFAQTGGHDCEVIAKLGAIPFPTPNNPSFATLIQQTKLELTLLTFEAMLDCICSALLPPNPPAGDPRVPLALVKVRKRDCRVISVCNWVPLRGHVLTFPTLTYWTGFLPFGRLIREGVHKLCCDSLGLRLPVGVKEQPSVVNANFATGGHSETLASGEIHPFMAKMAWHEPVPMNTRQQAAPDMISALLNRGMAGASAAPTGADLFAAIYERQPLAATLAGEGKDTAATQSIATLMATLGATVGPAMDAALPAMMMGAVAPAAAKAAPDRVEKLSKQLDAQKAEIATLRAMIATVPGVMAATKTARTKTTRKEG